MVLMPRSVTNPVPDEGPVQGPPTAGGAPPMDPRQMIMQMLMAQGQMPGGQEPAPEMNDMPDVVSARDARFGPVSDPARDQTQGELDTVSNSMGERTGDEDPAIQALTEQFRAALEEGDDDAVQELLGELEEAGLTVNDLPPDIRNQIDTGEDDAPPEGEVE